MYSIKAIVSLTGLGAETLRAWERRYRTVVPGRDDGGRRMYSRDDLDKLSLLANLTRQGHAIGKVSGLDIEQLQKLLNAGNEQSQERSLFAEQVIEALLEYRIDRCEQLLKRALMANEPLIYVRDILAPALNQVGRLWHEEKLNVAQEHIFSACVTRILLSMVNSLHSLSGNRPAMLFATPCGEPHEFGILMCCLLAAEQQYNCYYLGANVPAADLVDAARKLKAETVVLSLLKSPLDVETLTGLTAIVDTLAGHGIKLWLGGKGAEFWGGSLDALPKHCEIIGDFDHFYAKAGLMRGRQVGPR